MIMLYNIVAIVVILLILIYVSNLSPSLVSPTISQRAHAGNETHAHHTGVRGGACLGCPESCGAPAQLICDPPM